MDYFATKFLNAIENIVRAARATSAFHSEPHFHLKIPNPPYLDLVVEACDGPEGRFITVAHYRHKEGQPLPDPEVRYLSNGLVQSLTQWGNFTTKVSWIEDGVLTINLKHCKRVKHSLDEWAAVLVEQGFPKAAARLETSNTYSKPPNT